MERNCCGSVQENFVEQRCDDGVLEVMGLRDGWHSAFVLLSVRTAVRLCQVSPCEFAIRWFKFQCW